MRCWDGNEVSGFWDEEKKGGWLREERIEGRSGLGSVELMKWILRNERKKRPNQVT